MTRPYQTWTTTKLKHRRLVLQGQILLAAATDGGALIEQLQAMERELTLRKQEGYR